MSTQDHYNILLEKMYINITKVGAISVPDSIAVYSFALNPTDTAPSGTCNFSNIDDIKIERGDSKSNLIQKLNIKIKCICY